MSAFQDLYKKGLDRGAFQRQRQQELLKQQKLRRQQEQDGSRSLQKPRKPAPRNHNRKQRANGRQRLCPFRPQLSEWLREKPDDISEWMLVPCPVGRRCLVVAHNSKTKVYSKTGYVCQEFRSSLPGDHNHQKFQTILDCIYVEETDTFHVLDAISYGQQELQDCEAAFRFYWLRARFEENDFGKISEQNERTFVLVDHLDFEHTSAIEEVLQRYPLWEDNNPALDGFLFYHKEASYVCGTTPLVCWLFAFMLPDVLGMPVSSGYKAVEDYQPSQPLDYMNRFDQKLEQQREQRQKKRIKRQSAQEVAKEMEQPPAMEEEYESDEYASLKGLLDHERRLELGELDMDYAESPTAVGC